MRCLLPHFPGWALVLAASPAWASGGGEHHAEGIPWAEIGFHALNLGILIAVLVRFAGRPVRDALANRSTVVRKQIEEAAALHQAAQAKYAELDQRLSGFEAQLGQMRAEAEREAVREREAILARAEQEAAMIAEAAERTLRSELARARTELRAEAVALATGIARQHLQSQILPEDEERFSREFLATVKGVPHG